MNYTGIDYHKRYSVACTMDAQGRLLKQARIDDNAPEAFAAYFAALDEPSEAVIDADQRGPPIKGVRPIFVDFLYL
jgi:hypothetical protein